MNLTWASYVAPKPTNGGLKRKLAVFRVKSHFAWRKSEWGDDGKLKCVVTYANSLTSVRCLADAKRPCDCSYLIFARSVSAVTPIAQIVQLRRIGSPLRAFQWAYGEQRIYVTPSRHRVAQKRKMSKIWTIICDNFETVRDRMSVIVLITNRKSHTGFRLVPISVTLNGITALILCFFLTEFNSFAGRLCQSGWR